MRIESFEIKQQAIEDSEKLVKDRGQSITLYDEYMVLHREGSWEVMNEDLAIWQKIEIYNHCYYSRDTIYNMQLFFKNDNKKWILEVAGWTFVFEDQKESKALFDKIVKWRHHDFSLEN